MNDKIIIYVMTLDWTQGNIAFFDLKLSVDATVLIDWGDGKQQLSFTNYAYRTGNTDWLRFEHTYSKMPDVDYMISIEASEGEIIGINNWSMDMRIKRIDTSQCPSLEYLRTPYTEVFDVSENRLLKELDIESCNIDRLDLRYCNELKKLKCWCCNNLKHIAISNHSALEEIDYGAEYDLSIPLPPKSLEAIQRIIERNRKMRNEGLDLWD